MKVENDILNRRSRLKVFMLATLVGVIAGLMAIVYHLLLLSGLDLVKSLVNNNRLIVFLLPFLVYGLLYLSNKYILQQNTIFGVESIAYELADIDQFIMQPHIVLTKLINTLIALISGFAVGQFGPILYIGGAIGSNIGYRFQLHKNLIRVLIGCGVAAAISAIMHTPLFAVVFTIEVIFGKRYFDYMLPLIISSLTAYGLDRFYNGDIHFLGLNQLGRLVELSTINWLFIIFLAVCLGVLAAIYVIALRKMDAYFAKYSNNLLLFFILALAWGAVYYFMPLSHYLDANISENLFTISIYSLLLLIILRLVLTSLQLASGIYGGNFLPGLLLGVLAAILIFRLAPADVVAGFDLLLIICFAVVAMFSGFAHAPLSAVILALEASGEMSILMPALIIALISHLVSDFIAQESLFDLR